MRKWITADSPSRTSLILGVYIMNATLIYLIALGQPYWKLAKICIQSLRNAGKYTGDILLITDDTFFYPILNVTLYQANYKDSQCSKYWKVDCLSLIDLSRYQKIMYLDVDTICLKPIQIIFDYCQDDLIHSELPMLPGKFHSITGRWMGECLTEDEKVIADRRKVRGSNSGFFCCPSKLIKIFLDAWKYEIDRYKCDYAFDQPPFNAIIYRETVKCKPIPEYWIVYPMLYERFKCRYLLPSILPQSIMLHFCARNCDTPTLSEIMIKARNFDI